MITIILNLINKVMEGILISELKEKKIIDGSEIIPVESKNQNYNINVNNLKNFINDIEITDYNLLFDTYENKVWQNGLIDIETLLGKSIDNLIVSPVQEYPDMFKGVTIGNGKIRIGLPGINKDIVLDANDIETFKQSLVK
jgi:hypothetical protein